MRQQRQSTEEWENTVAAQQASGLKAYEYCAKHNIHIQIFYARRSEINKKTTQTSSKLVKVIQFTPSLISTTPPLAIIYHGGTLSVTQPVEAKWLTDVMKALTT